MFDCLPKKNSIDWSLIFTPKTEASSLSYLVRHMTVCPSEIFTGRLVYSKAFFSSMDEGSIVQIRRGRSLSFQDILFTLSVIGTFDVIARTGQVSLRDPGFWVRRPYGDGHVLQGSRPRPILPLDHLIAMTGYDARDMAQILRLLFEDNVIKILRNSSGVDGIMLGDGYINIERYRHALRT